MESSAISAPHVQAAGQVPALEHDRRRGRVRAAWMVAAGADLLQMVLFPFFSEGWLSPADDVLDVVVALALSKLIGFHWAFLPAAVAEVIPLVEVVPTWTASVWIATRRGLASGRRDERPPATSLASGPGT